MLARIIRIVDYLFEADGNPNRRFGVCEGT